MSPSYHPAALTTLAEVVRQFPSRGNHVALQFFNDYRVFRYTYVQIHDLILRGITFFESHGIRRGDRILIWSPNRPEWSVVYCACALRGFVLVPIDARHTAEFIRKVAAESEAKLLVQTGLHPPLNLPIPVLRIEDLFHQIQKISPAADNAEIQPDDWLEIAYTSGTTGDPKGVILTHGNIAANVSDVFREVQADSNDNFLSILPLSHSMEQTGGFWTPMAGGSRVTYLQVLKPSSMMEVFQRERVTIMIVVPRLLESLRNRMLARFQKAGKQAYVPGSFGLVQKLPRSLRKIWFFPVHKRFGFGMRFMVSGGATLSTNVEQFWRSLGFEVLQGYGLTETGPVLTVNQPGQTRLGSVGRPLTQVGIRLGNDKEILAKGPNVFQGYYKKPEATREVFTDGWFRTGDVGEMDSDGYLYIRSRKKNIIVTAEGINVYPEDIEDVLNREPGVRESCVLGWGEHQDSIHAVLLIAPGAYPADIIHRANEKLPTEQRIAGFSVWPQDEFPKTNTLKVQRNEVRKVLEQQGSSSKKDIEEGSRLHRILADLSDVDWHDIKPDSRMKQDLGLGSIDIVELALRLEQEFQIEVDDTAITADTTVRQIQHLIENPESTKTKLNFRPWTRSWPIRLIRGFFDWIIMRSILWVFCDKKVQGLENLRGIKGPIIVASNHTSHVDTPLITMLLPPRIGEKIAPAALREYYETEGKPLHMRIGKRIAWELTTILFNIFPFPQEVGFRKSMVYAGRMIDDGWSLLIFPEGERMIKGEMKKFANGVGVLWKNLKVPVLPVAIRGGEKVLQKAHFLPHRARVDVSFGQLFMPEDGTYENVTGQIEARIKEMWQALPRS